jgi:hypothetical protein
MAVIVANLVRGQKVPGLAELLFLAFPAVVAGQLWAIAVLIARWGPSAGGRWYRASWRSWPREFFAGLRWWETTCVMATFFLAWLIAVTAISRLRHGGPTSPTRSCQYRLVNHGVYSCVSRSTYIAVGAAEQRLVAGVLAGFFVAHLGFAAAELRRRGKASATAEPVA